MNLHKTILAAMLVSLGLAVVPALAGDDDHPSVFVTMCEKDPNKTLAKTKVMDMVSKTFDKADTRKQGRLDRNQAEDFSRMLTKMSGG